MTDVLVRRRPYGSLLFVDCEPVVLDFFRRDISSVDGELSYDERAMSEGPDVFDQDDVVVIGRGMGLNRHPKTGWKWLVEEAPSERVAALPAYTHLGDISDNDYPAIRGALETALGGFIGETGARRGLATATKMLHLKRPALIPICDSDTVAMLGIPLSPQASKAERVEAGLVACDLIRTAAKENRDELGAICAFLAPKDFDRTPVRVLDLLLWLAYGGNIRKGRPRPPA
jgi:hypothetical protein